MDSFLKYKTVSNKKVKKSLKPQKPYWDNDLSLAWNRLRDKEREFLSYKGSSKNVKNKMRLCFKDAQNKFDKLLRKKQRAYNKRQITELDEITDKNPKLFWDRLKRLGPKVSKQIPLKVKIEGTYESNIETVKKKWKTDFESLFTSSNTATSDFYKKCIEYRHTF